MRTYLTIAAAFALLTTTAQIDLSKMMGGMKVEDDNSPFVPNEFTGSFRMEMHLYKNGAEEKNSPTNMRYWSSEDMTMMQNDMANAKGQDMRILTDLKGKWQYTLMTDDKGNKTAMKSKKKKVTVGDDAADKKQEVTVTDESKVIDGHTCTKVIVKSEDGTWTGWMAKDVKAPFNDMARSAMQKGNGQLFKSYKGAEGMPLEFEWVDAKGKERIVSYIRDLKAGEVDASVFSLDGYEVTEMPGF